METKGQTKVATTTMVEAKGEEGTLQSTVEGNEKKDVPEINFLFSGNM